VYLACGTVVGLVFGDRVFPQLEAAFGDPLTDIVLGIAGLVLAATAYELVVMLLRSD